jgi:hypothetical protein
MSRSSKPKLLTIPPRGLHQGRLRRQPWMRRILIAAVMGSALRQKPLDCFDVQLRRYGDR